MPGARARTVVALARAVADGRLALMPNADIEATLDALRSLPGIGEWTAQYIAMRALSWPDAFPHTDLGVMKALGETDRAPSAARGRILEALARVRRDASLAFTDKGIIMHYYDLYEGPQGQMLLVADGEGLSGAYFDGQKYLPQVESDWRRDGRHAPLRQAKRELAEYFAGEREQFETALAPEGTPFQRSVWKAISTVGFGKTITYGELARRAGCPGNARAAGAATGRNPLTIIVPCHRIVGSNGSLTDMRAASIESARCSRSSREFRICCRPRKNLVSAHADTLWMPGLRRDDELRGNDLPIRRSGKSRNQDDLQPRKLALTRPLPQAAPPNHGPRRFLR
jgi:methylated-DNA-[protein]-cysteine S-methyltransferase